MEVGKLFMREENVTVNRINKTIRKGDKSNEKE
jgi:hypothetical protein